MAPLFSPDSDQSLFVDVGANIGACTMQVLMAFPKVKVVAFEPQHENLIRLTSTLSKLPPQHRKRIVVYPIGLSDMTSTVGNVGHLILGDAKKIAVVEPKNSNFVKIHVVGGI